METPDNTIKVETPDNTIKVETPDNTIRIENFKDVDPSCYLRLAGVFTKR